jgi:hypothetical protein
MIYIGDMKIKNILKIIFPIIFTSMNILAQPYYFDRGKLTESSPKFTLYNIEKINFSNGKKSIFLHNGGEYLTFDQTQTWIGIAWYKFYYIYNSSDTKNYFTVDPFIQILYSQKKKKIYLFCMDSNDVDKQLALYDVSENPHSKRTGNQGLNNRIGQAASYREFNPDIIDRQKTAFLHLFTTADLWEEAFFSLDENTIYFSIKDSAVNNYRIAFYSTKNNKIRQFRELSLFGYPNADGYILHRGRNGKGLIESYIKNKVTNSYYSYYNIYDFDNSTGSNFILDSAEAEPFISQDSNYLLLAEKSFEILKWGANYYNTGILRIYNVANSSLIKTLTYPARGTFFMSDSYPSNIYYIGPYKNRYIKNINIDSLIQSVK